MNKSKIEWCDSTWNPVTGCLHNCPYCYADKIANRFSMTNMHKITGLTPQNEVLLEPYIGFAKDGQSKIDPYPFGFSPTFHRYRLGEPARKTKGQKIFVCSMADLFGDWVPDEWIDEVFKVVKECPQHTFMFLTKNPKRYLAIDNIPDNAWLGASADTANRAHCNSEILEFIPAKVKFLSVEPLLEDVAQYISYDGIDWMIIGGETPKAKHNPIWISSLLTHCHEYKIPVFLKNNLWWTEKIQEWPEVRIWQQIDK